MNMAQRLKMLMLVVLWAGFVLSVDNDLL